MFRFSSKQMLITAAVLLLFGAILPGLMVAEVLKSSYWLNGIAFVFQISGTILGLFGTFSILKPRLDAQRRNRE